jgi:hypothetical protein
MISAVILTLISLIVMLAVDGLDPFAEVSSNPHPAVGMASIICAFIQPIMAAFRPHPGTRYPNLFYIEFGNIKNRNITFFSIIEK